MRLLLLYQLPRLLRIHTCASSSSVLSCHATPVQRSFSSTPVLPSKPLPPRRPILDSEITESFLKGSGPGGQKINKTSSAVQLKHLPTGIVVKCQETRSRTQNRKYARRLLQDRIEELELGDEARTRVKGRVASKGKASADKKKRRKYRALEEMKAGDVEVADTEGINGTEHEAPNHQTTTPVEEVSGDDNTRVGAADKAG